MNPSIKQILLCAFLGTAACRPVAAPPPAVSMPTARLTFPDGGTITVDIADTPDRREQGLMFKESLPRDYGMIFTFPREQGLQFWMKNTLVDLDMVFIDRDKRVASIAAGVPRSRLDTPDEFVARRSGSGKYVLELPTGAAKRHGLKAGDRLVFDVPEVSL